jgi:hypothetical protein
MRSGEIMKDASQACAGILVMAVLLGLGACGDRQGPEAAGAVARPLPPAAAPSGAPSIDYVSEPDPPRSGENVVSVQVHDKDGSAMPDLAVTVTYYMPAMPAMNMPEMRDSFALVHDREGTYSGKVSLSMGGAWTVTVVAMRGDEPVARKQLNILARQ